MGAPLIVAGSTKLVTPQPWLIAVHEWAPGLAGWLPAVAMSMAVGEVVLGLLAVTFPALRLVCSPVLVIACLFVAIALAQVTTGATGDCACFGAFSQLNHATVRVALGSLMAVSAVSCLRAARPDTRRENHS